MHVILERCILNWGVKGVIYSNKCMGDMTTIHLCMCFVQKSVFLITCPVQRDVLLSNYACGCSEEGQCVC